MSISSDTTEDPSTASDRPAAPDGDAPPADIELPAAADTRTYAGFPNQQAATSPRSATDDGSKRTTPPVRPVVQRSSPAAVPGAERKTNQLRNVVLLGTIALSGVVGSVVLMQSSRATTEQPSSGESPASGDASPGATVPAAIDEPIASMPLADPVVSTPVVSTPAVAAPVDPAPAEPVDVVPADSVPAAPAPDVPAAPVAEVAESTGVVRNGQIFLSGAVPTVEAGEQIAALAAEILGPDNVFNNYVIDPRATDPSLGNLTVEDTINFGTDSAEILPGSELLLNQGLALMTIRPAMTVTIVGHTDDRGSVERNDELSLARAETVKQWFVDRGISADRFTVVGAGSREPIADNATAEGQRINRRIQFFLENLLAGS